jgi:hypothetical protein
MSAPQRQHARPSADCVGIFMPASHIAYFQAVHARSQRQASKSASVRVGWRTAHAAAKSARAWSMVADVPLRCCPDRIPG